MAWILHLVPCTNSLWGIIMWRGIVRYLSYLGDSGCHSPNKKTQGSREQVWHLFCLPGHSPNPLRRDDGRAGDSTIQEPEPSQGHHLPAAKSFCHELCPHTVLSQGQMIPPGTLLSSQRGQSCWVVVTPPSKCCLPVVQHNPCSPGVGFLLCRTSLENSKVPQLPHLHR